MPDRARFDFRREIDVIDPRFRHILCALTRQGRDNHKRISEIPMKHMKEILQMKLLICSRSARHESLENVIPGSLMVDSNRSGELGSDPLSCREFF